VQVHSVHREPQRELALVVMGSDDGHALVYLSLAGDRPVPVEVTVKAARPPSVKRCKEMLAGFQPRGLSPVSTALIRSLALSSALYALQVPTRSRLERVKALEEEARGGVPEGFRTARDYHAARERVLVAAAYVDRVQAGDPTPVQSLAEAFDKPKGWVNKRLAAARTAGYLTSLGHGRLGGDLTEAAYDLLLGAEESDEVDEDDDWDEDEEVTEEEIAEYEKETALEALRAQEEEEVETYGGWVLCPGCFAPYEYIDPESVCPECG
jgi:hypothetical protein